MSTARAALAGFPGKLRHAWAEDGAQTGAGARWRPPARDIVIAVVITVITVIASYSEAHPSARIRAMITAPNHLPNTPAAALALVAVAGAALAWRRRSPRLAVCVSTVCVTAYTIPGYVNGAALLLPALALGTLATTASVRASVAWTAAVTGVLMAVTGANNPTGWFDSGFFFIPADNAVAMFAGIALANRRAFVETVRVQSARRSAQEAQRRVDEERLRIARELHDVVAHTMATITVQSAAATQLLRDRPDEAAESLRAIRAASKDGLRELRAILDVLRSASGGAAEPADPTQPPPGLGRLDALVSGVRSAGLPVTVTVTGRRRDLSAVTDLSAFRIIQEALTNTLRHAGPATAAVTLDYGEDELRVEVTDTGRGLTDSAAGAVHAAFIIRPGLTGLKVTAPAAVGQVQDPPERSTGHGLRGMRERATAAGGTIEIGRLPEGGFRVAAALPFAPGRARSAGSANSAGVTPQEQEKAAR